MQIIYIQNFAKEQTSMIILLLDFTPSGNFIAGADLPYYHSFCEYLAKHPKWDAVNIAFIAQMLLAIQNRHENRWALQSGCLQQIVWISLLEKASCSSIWKWIIDVTDTLNLTFLEIFSGIYYSHPGRILQDRTLLHFILRCNCLLHPVKWNVTIRLTQR